MLFFLLFIFILNPFTLSLLHREKRKEIIWTLLETSELLGVLGQFEDDWLSGHKN